MGPGCVILVWLIVAAVGGGIWLGCVLLFLIGKLRKSRLIMWLGGVPLALVTIVVVGLVGLLGVAMVRAMNPSYVYEDTFHERPSPDVRHLKSSVWSFADEGHVFMRFEASPETFHRIVPRKMKKVSYSDYKKTMPGSNLKPPAWWSPPTEATSEIYISVPDFGHGGQFASETRLMTYDAATGTAMYFYIGID